MGCVFSVNQFSSCNTWGLQAALFCNFLLQRSNLRIVTRHFSKWAELKLQGQHFYSTTSGIVWQRCGLLSSSCPLTGSSVPGLVPATKLDMFTKQAWTSRFLKIHTHNKRRFLEWKPTMRLLSAALCWSRKAAGFLFYYLIDGGLLWTDQIAKTRKNHSHCCYLFLFCRCKKSPLRMLASFCCIRDIASPFKLSKETHCAFFVYINTPQKTIWISKVNTLTKCSPAVITKFSVF